MAARAAGHAHGAAASSEGDGATGAQALLDAHYPSHRHAYTERDVCLYALGLGCGAADLRYTYEAAPGFAPLPTFAAIPAHPAIHAVPLAARLPRCDPARGVHAEHYIQLGPAPLPPAADTVTTVQVLEVTSKAKGALVVTRTVTKDARLGHTLALNEFTSFIIGTAPFPSASSPVPRAAAATAPNAPPARPPDAAAEERISPDQAALYRLSGDLNPLHIDPEVAAYVGFPRPILHGLCTMGVSARLVLARFGGGDPGAVHSIKVRFSKHVFPGDTLRVEMWALPERDTVVFETRVVGRPGAVLSNAAVVFRPGRLAAGGGGGGSGDGGGDGSGGARARL